MKGMTRENILFKTGVTNYIPSQTEVGYFDILVGYFIHFFCDKWDKSFFISGSNAANGGKNWDELRNCSRQS